MCLSCSHNKAERDLLTKAAPERLEVGVWLQVSGRAVQDVCRQPAVSHCRSLGPLLNRASRSGMRGAGGLAHPQSTDVRVVLSGVRL